MSLTLKSKICKTILIPILVLSFQSCMYRAHYQANYVLKEKSGVSTNFDEIRNYVSELVKQNALSKAPNTNGIDTLEYQGLPYHSFEFQFQEKDSVFVLNIDYRATSFHGRKNPPYRTLFSDLHSYVFANFTVVEEHVDDVRNGR